MTTRNVNDRGMAGQEVYAFSLDFSLLLLTATFCVQFSLRPRYKETHVSDRRTGTSTSGPIVAANA